MKLHRSKTHIPASTQKQTKAMHALGWKNGVATITHRFGASISHRTRERWMVTAHQIMYPAGISTKECVDII